MDDPYRSSPTPGIVAEAEPCKWDVVLGPSVLLLLVCVVTSRWMRENTLEWMLVGQAAVMIVAILTSTTVLVLRLRKRVKRSALIWIALGMLVGQIVLCSALWVGACLVTIRI
jgi:zinc transporter ZupT